VRRKTKIIATLGPAVADAQSISDLVEAGMDVARLNFSHGEHHDHKQNLRWVHEASEKHGRAVEVLQDIQGPKIRVGTFPDGAISLEAGQQELFNRAKRKRLGAKCSSNTSTGWPIWPPAT